MTSPEASFSDADLLEAQRGLEAALGRLREAERSWWAAPARDLVQARYLIMAAEREVAHARGRLVDVVQRLHEAERARLPPSDWRWTDSLARLQAGGLPTPSPTPKPHGGPGDDSADE